MGTYINLDISKSVANEEWAKVYEEALLLLEELPFAERGQPFIHGAYPYCWIRSKEREFIYENHDLDNVGWCTSGDYFSLIGAEEYHIPKVLLKDNEFDPDAGDAMRDFVDCYYDSKWDRKNRKTICLWGGKTQEEFYHFLILAVACLIEDRLKDKAFLHGVITYNQCEFAVNLVNEILENKISMPTCCDLERITKRLDAMDLSSDVKSEALKLCCCIRLNTETKESEYIINEYEDLRKYKTGDTIAPDVFEIIIQSFEIYDTFCEEDTFKQLMNDHTSAERYAWLVHNSRQIMLRDTDWERIYEELHNDKESFRRYYPMCRVRPRRNSHTHTVIAFATNDELYDYLKKQ